jgi:UDP-N-acetylmuramoyl-tripeptide--D-alanyl-D-alanine ligase
MIQSIISFYSWRYPKTVVYMLQSCEYQIWPYLKWYWQTTNFSKVTKRRSLLLTKPARMLLLVMYIGQTLELLIGGGLIMLYAVHGTEGTGAFGLALIVAAPLLWAQLIVVPLLLGRVFIVKPKAYLLIKQSEQIFREHKGVKIAVAGSYGKTTMKDLLATVLSIGKTIAVTPGNKNVSISHAYFAKRLTGKEDVVIIEYGEGAPGDVARFARITHPTDAVITGLAPAHLDHYRTLQAAGEDIFSVADYVKPHHAYVNAEAKSAADFIEKHDECYDQKGALGWKVNAVTTDITGLHFTLKKDKKTLHLKSGLIGRHQVGPLAFVAAFAERLGMNLKQIEEGIAQTKPFEHRMQPYPLHGAWIIDDTYNGNIEGIRVGTEILKELSATRKIYVTPGLVDQGEETKAVHEKMGEYIATANPDKVVLMQNSVTNHIQQGLVAGGYEGEVIVEDNPLHFYTNLSLFVAAGDVVLMQNDWPDNYY